MGSSKKILLTTIGIAVMIVTLVGVTYSFFNYVRTGSSNIIKVGRISFNTSQSGNINLTNVFPIASEELENDQDNHDSITVTITGDTTYEDGVEYLITFEEVNNIINNKHIPVTFSVEETNIGTSSSNYFNERGGETSIYQLTEEGKIQNSKYILVGYIAPGQTGINGTIEITAFVDADKIAISDTYDGFESDNMGTTREWADGRVVFTTEEWNSFVGNNEISFKVKVEANVGIWVEAEATPASCFTYEVYRTYNTNRTNNDINSCVEYLTDLWGEEEEGNNVDVGETYADFCAGTGTNWGETINYYIEQDIFNENQLMKLEKINIVSNDFAATLIDYDENCGSDVIIPRNIDITYDSSNYTVNPNMNTTTCVEILTDLWGAEEEGDTIDVGETYSSFCSGTGTIHGQTFQEMLDNYMFNDLEIDFLAENGIVDELIETTIRSATVTKLYGTAASGLGQYFGVFSGKGLTSVVIPDSIVTISGGAFANNYLTSVVIPDSVTELGGGCFFENNLTSVVLPNNITGLPKGIFYHNNLSSITIPDSVTYIDDFSFSDNQLTSLNIPNGVTIIGRDAFLNNQLTHIDLPESIYIIRSRAFRNNKITNIELLTNSVHIDHYAFYDNDITSVTLKELKFASNVDGGIVTDAFDWTKVNYINTESITTDICNKPGINNRLQGDLVLGNRLTSIPAYTFGGCNLNSITIPNTVTNIGSNAFSIDEGITSVTIDKTCSAIKNMSNYPWISVNNRTGTTIFGSNNEVCDSW